MTLCGIKHIVPFDETVEAMYRVGKSMPHELRETAMGGLAATPTACGLCKNIFK
jgi:L-serine dehydratase